MALAIEVAPIRNLYDRQLAVQHQHFCTLHSLLMLNHILLMGGRCHLFFELVAQVTLTHCCDLCQLESLFRRNIALAIVDGANSVDQFSLQWCL
ncbi:hypothetical protein C1752_07473 [Acaryochloris thomasi RCC1774]|uniref:Uncharacterized protein n=1 Tax=Acaryochloris thomasi RCC1774 TaxID=1764569 RepID=A0A2W1JQK8_9CYAN|nr:hypothetical protein C1752_07473 [Acaryochloris thomasi RCC1774]